MKKLSLKKLIKLFLICYGILFFWSCSTSEYHKLVKTELNKKIKFDSLFFDIKLGERKEDYFDKIWELNKKGIIFPATGEYGTLRYILKNENSSSDSLEIIMDFFPGFNKKNRLNKLKKTEQGLTTLGAMMEEGKLKKSSAFFKYYIWLGLAICILMVAIRQLKK